MPTSGLEAFCGSSIPPFRPARLTLIVTEPTHGGEAQLEDWEVHFREKSSRRAHVRTIEDRMKLGVLSILGAGLAGAGWLMLFGPR